MMIQLNANAGTCMFASSKAELIKYLDVVNSHNLDSHSQQAEHKYSKLKQLTAQTLISNTGNSINSTDITTVFTGTGTEANCLAIKAVVQFMSCQTCELPDTLHIVSTAYEHKSILSCLEQLSHAQSPYKRKVSVSLVKPQCTGQVRAEDVLAAIQPNTVLISIMCINNETGADNRQALISIGRGIQSIRATRKLPILFHSDAVQAFGKYQVPFEAAHLDMVSVSFYKIFGPNRIGALAARRTALDIITAHPLINTSLLESDLTHGGTQSMSLVAAALNSLKVVSINRINKNNRLLSLRNHLETLVRGAFRVADYCEIQDRWESVIDKKWLLICFSSQQYCIPNTFMFTLIRRVGSRLDAPCGTKLLQYFAQNGIIVATGSACGQTAKQQSTGSNSVLQAIGVPEKLQQSAIRVSFSDTTIKKELYILVNALVHYLHSVYEQSD